MSDDEALLSRSKMSLQYKKNMGMEIAQSVHAISKDTREISGRTSIPFSPITGKEYSGQNMVRLMLASIEHGYTDNRWIRREELHAYQFSHLCDQDLQVKSQEQGVVILQPENIPYCIADDGKRYALTEREFSQLCHRQVTGETVPRLGMAVLFNPITVYNASQIEHFPARELARKKNSEDLSKNAFSLLAAAGIRVDFHEGHYARYNSVDDIVLLPFPPKEGTPVDTTLPAMALRQFYHATAAEQRECRTPPLHIGPNIEPVLEDMGADIFTLMAMRYLGCPEKFKNRAIKLENWHQKLEAGDYMAIYSAAATAGKMLSLLHQFSNGEQPRASWFPKKAQWKSLYAAQSLNTQRCITRTLLHKSLPFLHMQPDTLNYGTHVQNVLATNAFDSMREELRTVSHMLTKGPALQQNETAQNLAKAMHAQWERIAGFDSSLLQKNQFPLVTPKTTTPDVAASRIRMR